jgi:CTP:molybdopterin cytidylyltransferase MocA
MTDPTEDLPRLGQPQTGADFRAAVDSFGGAFLDALTERTAKRAAKIVLEAVLPKLEASGRVQALYLTVKSAAAYIDKTYQGMRYTINQHPRDLPIIMVGDKPFLDIHDIDRFMSKRKRK